MSQMYYIAVFTAQKQLIHLMEIDIIRNRYNKRKKVI